MVFFAGQTAFRGAGPIRDPIFQTSRRVDSVKNFAVPPGSPASAPRLGLGLWLLDREASAIACHGQFRLFSLGDNCFGWRGSLAEEFYSRETGEGPLSLSLDGLPMDLFLLFYNAFQFGSTYGYLRRNRRLLLASAWKKNNKI